MGELEVQSYAEKTRLHTLEGASSVRDAVVVRVKYRPKGSRRWNKFFVVPKEGQTIEELLNHAEELAESHAEYGAR